MLLAIERQSKVCALLSCRAGRSSTSPANVSPIGRGRLCALVSRTRCVTVLSPLSLRYVSNTPGQAPLIDPDILMLKGRRRNQTMPDPTAPKSDGTDRVTFWSPGKTASCASFIPLSNSDHRRYRSSPSDCWTYRHLITSSVTACDTGNSVQSGP